MRTRVSFQGRVQGVGFRATAHSIARRFPVTGWVRNEPDGSVLLEVQGDEPQARAFIDELRRTMGAYVRSVDAATIPDDAGEAGFVISR